MSEEHTPGPWEARQLDADPHKPDTYILGHSLPNHWRGFGTFISACEPGSAEGAANIRLMVAAPKLLAELQAAVAWIEQIETYTVYDQSAPRRYELLPQLKAAIAKARGSSS